MKVALLLSGHTRSYRKNEKFFYENILNKYNVDVFISTWIGSGFVKNHSFAYLHKQNEIPKSELELNKTPGIDQDIDVDHLKSVFQPKAIVIDKPTDNHISEIRSRFSGLYDQTGATCDSCALSYYKMYDCNNLKKQYEQTNNFKYDVVIRGRFDFAVTKMDLNVDMNMIHIKVTPRGASEVWFFGNSDIMDMMGNIYVMLIPKYLESIPNQDVIPLDTMKIQNIPYHHCMDMRFVFVKPPFAIEYDTGTYLAPYDKFDWNSVR